MQRNLNSGLYKVGFAESREVYGMMSYLSCRIETPGTLDESCGLYLFGKELIEVGPRLYPSLIWFNTEYVQYFECIRLDHLLVMMGRIDWAVEWVESIPG